MVAVFSERGAWRLILLLFELEVDIPRGCRGLGLLTDFNARSYLLSSSCLRVLAALREPRGFCDLTNGHEFRPQRWSDYQSDLPPQLDGRCFWSYAVVMDSRTSTSGRWLVVAAGLLWSTSGFFAQVPVFDIWPVSDGGWPTRGILLAFWRAVIATVVLLPFVRRPSFHWGMVPMAICFVIMNIVYLAAMTRTSAANAAWLQYTAPLWVYFVGVVVLKEKTQRRDGVMIALVAIGLAIILAFEARGESLVGIAYGLTAGITFAGVMLSLRILRDEDPAWLVAWNHLVTAVVLLPFVVMVGIWPNGAQLPYLIAFGSLQMGIPYLLFARGVRRISGHEAAAIALLEPLLVPLWVYWAWGNTTSWATLVGGALILAGLLVRYLGSSNAKADETATA